MSLKIRVRLLFTASDTIFTTYPRKMSSFSSIISLLDSNVNFRPTGQDWSHIPDQAIPEGNGLPTSAQLTMLEAVHHKNGRATEQR